MEKFRVARIDTIKGEMYMRFLGYKKDLGEALSQVHLEDIAKMQGFKLLISTMEDRHSFFPVGE